MPADIALPRVAAAKSRRGAPGDFIFLHLTFLFALLVLLILGGVIVALIDGALPALRYFGGAFLYTDVWNPVTEKFGALAPIFGTLVTSAIAMVVGIPVAFGVAMFITEICPIWLNNAGVIAPMPFHSNVHRTSTSHRRPNPVAVMANAMTLALIKRRRV